MKLLFILVLIIASVTAICPSFGTAEQYGALAGSTVTNTGATMVAGSVGVSPGTEITGFPPGQKTGVIDTGAASGHASIMTLYDTLVEKTCYNISGVLGGQTYLPGVYCSTTVELTGSVTLDGNGASDGIWIFQMDTTLTAAADSAVIHVNGSLPCNVFWAVGTSASFGGGDFSGTVIAQASITMTTASNITGHLFAIDAAVTLDTNNIHSCNCDGMVQPVSPSAYVVPPTAGTSGTPINPQTPGSVGTTSPSGTPIKPQTPGSKAPSSGSSTISISILAAFVALLSL